MHISITVALRILLALDIPHAECTNTELWGFDCFRINENTSANSDLCNALCGVYTDNNTMCALVDRDTRVTYERRNPEDYRQ